MWMGIPGLVYVKGGIFRLARLQLLGSRRYSHVRRAVGEGMVFCTVTLVLHDGFISYAPGKKSN